MLWDVGVDTFDVSCGKTFRLHAALTWTINDFLADGMLSGWSTHGLLACSICRHENYPSSYSMDESHFSLIAIVGFCLGIIVLGLIKLLFIKVRAYTLAFLEGFLVKYCLM